jgi:hypothetical protein
MDMSLDPELALRRSSRLGALAVELAESASRVRGTRIGSPPGIDAAARRDAAASGLAEHAARLASIATDLRHYARSVGEHDAAVADRARRMGSLLPSIIHPGGGGPVVDGRPSGPAGWPL